MINSSQPSLNKQNMKLQITWRFSVCTIAGLRFLSYSTTILVRCLGKFVYHLKRRGLIYLQKWYSQHVRIHHVMTSVNHALRISVLCARTSKFGKRFMSTPKIDFLSCIWTLRLKRKTRFGTIQKMLLHMWFLVKKDTNSQYRLTRKFQSVHFDSVHTSLIKNYFSYFINISR